MKKSLTAICVLILLAAVTACNGRETARAEPEPARVMADGEEPGAVVLMYHRFGDDRHPSTNIRLEQFEAHLDYLQEQGFNIWPLAQVVRQLESGEPFPGRTVAITIDDAYRSTYEEAFPRLRELGWPYTVFVNSDATDDGLADYMTWEQMREMAQTGATFANHSASHDFLVTRREGESERAWRQRVRSDIERAEQRLRQELGDAVPDSPALHAYPFGEYDNALREMVRDMGFVAFGQQSGPVGPHSDMGALPRFAMAESYGDPDDFHQRVNTRPFPLRAVEPSDPTAVDQRNPPTLQLRLAAGDFPRDRISCFAGQHGTDINWIDREKGVLEVRAQGNMPEGRSRYNCTAPAGEGRHYWFSQLWLRGR